MITSWYEQVVLPNVDNAHKIFIVLNALRETVLELFIVLNNVRMCVVKGILDQIQKNKLVFIETPDAYETGSILALYQKVSVN